MRLSIPLLPLVVVPLLAQTPAQPSGDPLPARPLATWRNGDRQETVTFGDVAIEMAFHLRRKSDGREASGQLVAYALLRRAAKANGIAADPAQVQALWTELQRQLKAQGRDPMQEPIVRNGGVEALLADVELQLLHEQLVRKQLDLGAGEHVSGDMLKLWLQEERRRVPVVDDPDQLPLGTAARIDGVDVPLLDLGLLLARRSDDETLDRYIRQVVVLRLLEREARELGIAVTRDDLSRELEERRRDVERDPTYRGVPFEDLLKTQGITSAWLLESSTFRAQLLQKRITAAQHPRAELLAELGRDRAAVLARAGARRHLGIVFVRALATPNPLVPRTFPDAMAHLAKVKERLARDQFADVATIESEDPASKPRGGDVGWCQRSNDGLPEVVNAAAWDLKVGEVSAPIQATDGCYLVKVLEVEPEPTEDRIVERMQAQLAADHVRQMLLDARIERTDGRKLWEAPAGEPRNR